MAAMKTPGVYIVEKNAFPNSVVEVATAVPAFIGYTQKAETLDRKPLKGIPHRITSMSEFIQHFGDAPPATFSLEKVANPTDPPASGDFRFGDDVYKLARAGTEQHYLLYHSMQFFFQNGGGPCYIVSVGSYDDDIEAGDSTSGLIGGLTPLVKEQEPTMVLTPDAVRLEQNDCELVQEQVLMHCAVEMKKSRFAIFDVHDGYQEQTDPVTAFREGIGANNLDFGAAYYPWLNTSIVQARDLGFENLDSGGRTILRDLLQNELGLDDPPPITQAAATAAARRATTAEAEAQAATESAAAMDDGDAKAAAEAKAVSATAAAATLRAAAAGLAEAVDAAVAASAAKTKAAEAPAGDTGEADRTASTTATATAKTKQEAVPALFKAAVEANENLITPDRDAAAKATLRAQLNRVTADIADGDEDLVEQLNKDLRGMSPKGYSTVINQMRAQLNALPPAAAMAGIYTAVDNSRGVWKAPANVSVNSVISPTVGITHDEQENLNVHVSGKSINAIRSFVGEGTLVWGARTLDGNSLDWRYIQVRRTMIMLEESIRLASKAYVFEANDANTWVTIKSTIRNFLTGIWKRGGLAGASPDDAFQVFVGLGETMTPEDILEGILKVTVLVAPTRPAEFIEITFQQKMQES